jgi:hypothetical protein
MKGETRKIYRALLSLYKSTIIPMIWWGFVSAGFFLKPDNLRGHVGVNRIRALERIEVPELSVDEGFMYRKQSTSQLSQEYRHVDGPSSSTDFIRGQSFCIHRESYRNLPSLWSWRWHRGQWRWGGRDWLNFRSDNQMVNLIFWLNRSEFEGTNDDHFPFNNQFCTGL